MNSRYETYASDQVAEPEPYGPMQATTDRLYKLTAEIDGYNRRVDTTHQRAYGSIAETASQNMPSGTALKEVSGSYAARLERALTEHETAILRLSESLTRLLNMVG